MAPPGTFSTNTRDPRECFLYVNRYDGWSSWFLGMRYQATPYGGEHDHAGLPDQSVYARTYRRVVKKALARFVLTDEPVGKLTGYYGSFVGRQTLVARVRVEITP